MTKLREDDADMQVTDGAVATIRQNAEDGLVEAEFFLGDMYREGRGVQQDGVEAAKWYRKAADQGHTEAKYALGLMYYYGEVVRQDYMEAVRWYRLAAEEGHTDAKYALGVMYRMGRGVLQDYAESYKWHNLAASEVWAADNGVEELKRYEDARDAVAKLMPPPQIAEAQRLAREWKTLHPGVGIGPERTFTQSFGTLKPVFSGRSEESGRRDRDQEEPSVRDRDQGDSDDGESDDGDGD